MSGGWYARWGKRAVDLSISLPALLVLSPVLLVIAVVIRVLDGAPVLFRQSRPGLNGKAFTLLKFRSMGAAPHTHVDPRTDALRLTPLGRVLRSTSLDELPELWNVIRGDMSLVGPRPLLMQYLERYSPAEARRHEVKPGITGWAQIQGRNRLDWAHKFACDVWYVDHLSFGLDLKIMVMTLGTILSRDGISSPGQATMPEFRGSDPDAPNSSGSSR